ncbi:MAG: 1-(5-phosphoribosyl)-5-[(5-phosphoribosylamino)methylideneamino] imidazole-4-carboxamide isomerase, partial [Rhodospirillaceae bacterium]|nr:1-(5-phosphoribosyl)-5-[(5-phosphoribosylamino)methylideneamino] imidazole-4-carboxamide isomerase [Rhodospirillaceae bacterium]
MGGQAVQLVGGKEMAIEAGDPRPIAEKFRLVGEIAVIDLDAALGQGDNRALIEELVSIAPCRVGGGIRDVETAISRANAAINQCYFIDVNGAKGPFGNGRSVV